MTSDFLFEFKRQMVHIIVGLIMAFFVYILKPILGVYILLPMLVIILLLWFAPRVEGFPAVKHLINHFERREDIERFPFKGAFWYNVGMTFPIVLLSRELAAAIIVILSVGDGMSTLIGRFYGRHRIGHKSLEGFFSFLIFGTVGAMVLLDFRTAATLAALGAIIELFGAHNDNLTIPVGLTVVSFILGLQVWPPPSLLP